MLLVAMLSLGPPPSCRPDATWPTTVSFWGEAKHRRRCDGWPVTLGRRLILLTGLSLTRGLLPPLPLHPPPQLACCCPHGEHHMRLRCHPAAHLLLLFRLLSPLMHDTLGANKLWVKPPHTAIWLPTAVTRWRQHGQMASPVPGVIERRDTHY
ncbi:hypothetical protein GWK47_031294 [Chionoecetes opilio]|uniref:Uncharacterized protein n=1 Tax=Chionoecetes opilio TaxID=41210 RepID=A0A8J4YR40_CHIOP|nr:hypothetical protein GWK47_031294 [Chionoecetes opilio]